jgi:ATP-dependent 26S proteasome regulatory subunit
VANEIKAPRLSDYIQAGYPAIFLRTVEPQVAEARVLQALKDLDMHLMDFGVWKITTGLMLGRVDGSVTPVDRGRDLLDALKFVEDLDAQRQPLVAVFHNLRQFVGNFQVIQQMIDSIFAARLRGSHIILVGPHIELPPELKNLIQFYDVQLPSRDQIEQEFRQFCKAYSDQIKMPKKAEADDLIRAAANAAVGLDMMGAENAIALSLATAETVDVRIIQAQKEQEVRKSDVLEFVPTDETMDNVGGFAALKTWLWKRRRAFTEEARKYGLPFPKGMLVVGPAGTGKSLCAKAVASYLQLPLLRVDMGRIFRSLVGESEAAVRHMLMVAEAVSPVVLWFDEIEKGMAGMAGSGELDSGVTSRVVSTILTWRQETKKPVMLMATANNVATLPSMVYRKGRLDEVWATDIPSQEERQEIFKIHLRKRNRKPEKFNVELLSARSDNFVGAEIEGVIEDAMFSAFDDDKEVTDAYILNAIKETIPQSIRDADELRAIREWVKSRARLVSGGEKAVAAEDKIRKLHAPRKGGKA